ncbi:hypothetical protein K461DRAFT_270570 [Myriangium duriaei CBS 260.36]|uniref:Amidoligase enzyme n=1 Tax=Myriangium duriaei CBS 260.36 TaxID=1168546 RepID=A0A9P4MHH9_9PEZI|nr:hypothetical protein K461DRAFT_270570 [Myriangium duriaei CBS 260.36]
MSLTIRPSAPLGTFGTGLETEFLLTPLDARTPSAPSMVEFAKTLRRGYNRSLTRDRHDNTNHPEINSVVLLEAQKRDFYTWSLARDCTIKCPRDMTEQHGTYGLEVISPILRIHEDSKWREHVAHLWNYLEAHYSITDNDSCGTHVHISLNGGYRLEQLQSISACIIHFEPALLALLPSHRRRNHWFKSNWIDNDRLGKGNLSRQESIKAIQRTGSIGELCELMCPRHDKNWAWSFHYILHRGDNGTIEFRRPPASTDVDDVFMWIEVTMVFIKAAMELEEIDELTGFHATVEGLERFMRYTPLSTTPGLFEPHNLDDFFATAAGDQWRQPAPCPTPTPELAALLRQKKQADDEKQLMAWKLHKPAEWS